MSLTRRSLAAALIGAAALPRLALPRLARAADTALPVPTGKVILTISGKIGAFNAGDAARFDREMLEALDWSSFTTSTPWYDTPVTFSGVHMQKLMQAVRADGDVVVAAALNDYETKIPMSDFSQFNVLLALKRNGDYMPVREKGPLFIVYPYDSSPELKSQKYYSRSAWQLARLAIV
jgi:hypothetical protein